MCADCPHCAETDCPCQAAFGSSAEIMGGLAGRGDAIVGAVDCQKTTASLHLHFWFVGQRLHKFHTLEEIANLLEQEFVKADDLKDFLENISCESYPNMEQHKTEMNFLEQQW